MKSKFGNFFKRNGYYVLLGVCIVAIVCLVTFSIIYASNEKIKVETPVQETELPPEEGNNEPAPPVINDEGNDEGNDDNNIPVIAPVTFSLPVDSCNILREYTVTVSFNQTVNKFESHKAIDFLGNNGDNVYCVLDGEVESVTTSYLEGTTVIINHGNGLKTEYKSLTDAGTLYEGLTVGKGEVIGTMSDSYALEYRDGVHLHFAVMENGEYIDPEKYLVLENK